MDCFDRRDAVNLAKCPKRSIQNASHLLVASMFASRAFPALLMYGRQLPFGGDALEQRFSTHRWVSAVMFFEMRHAAAPAFKRTYIGQCAETLRPSNQSHVLSAAWAQRQLGPRAFSIHDETRLGAIHARLHWLHLLVGHSLAVVEARMHTPQTSAKKKTDGTLNHYNEWPPVSSPTLQ